MGYELIFLVIPGCLGYAVFFLTAAEWGEGKFGDDVVGSLFGFFCPGFFGFFLPVVLEKQFAIDFRISFLIGLVILFVIHFRMQHYDVTFPKKRKQDGTKKKTKLRTQEKRHQTGSLQANERSAKERRLKSEEERRKKQGRLLELEKQLGIDGIEIMIQYKAMERVQNVLSLLDIPSRVEGFEALIRIKYEEPHRYFELLKHASRQN